MEPLITPRTLSGFKDRLPHEAMAKSRLLRTFSDVFESFGFAPIETPHLEYAEILVKQGSEEIQKELYRFKDHGGRDVALRFDQTVPLARFITQHRGVLGLPFKRYAIGNVFRGERAQKGRYREFTQCDFDFIGSDSIGADAEIVQVIYASLKALGIEDFTIWINNRKILNGICEHLGIEAQTNDALRIVDKLDKIGKESVIDELVNELGIAQKKAQELLDFVLLKEAGDRAQFFENIKPYETLNKSLHTGISELRELFNLLSLLKINPKCLKINFSIARGLGYYTGIIYETTLNALSGIGSVCSGGRYDNLTQNFAKEPMSGVGASIGIDRLLAALEELGIAETRATPAQILIICMENCALAYGYKIAQELRTLGIRSETYPEAVKLKKSLNYANSKGHKFVAILGEEELNSGTLTLKNMHSGEQNPKISSKEATKIIMNANSL